jgi:putative ABC transport system substrate-binding protein
MVEAFRAARNEGAEALNVFSSPFLSSLYQEIIDLSAEHRLPAIYQWKEHAEAGGLISYGPGLAAMWRQSGAIVVRVLKGAKPADVPVEQPTKFEPLSISRRHGFLVLKFRRCCSVGRTTSNKHLLCCGA